MNDNTLIKTIVDTYLSHLDEFDHESKVRHFLYRAYGATGREDVKELFLARSRTYTFSRENILTKYEDSFDDLVSGVIKRTEGEKVQKVNDKKKFEQWLLHPRLRVLSEVLVTVFYLNIFELREPSSIHLPKIDELKKELLSSRDFITFAVVSAVNIVYFAKNLKIFDCEESFLEIFRDVFARNMKSNELFTNYIYGLTHIIIGESEYYTKHIDVSKYEWILNELMSHSEEIYTQLTLDINVEVAICMRMLGVAENMYISNVRKWIGNNFDEKCGFVSRGPEGTIFRSEHVNSIVLILLNFDKIQFKKSSD